MASEVGATTMQRSQVLSYVATWGAIGCGLFTIFVMVAFRSGLVYTARREDGTLKRRVPFRGVLAMLIIPVALLLLQIAANFTGLARQGVRLPFGRLYALNLAHYLVLFVYDTLVIDGLVLGLWRPDLLRLPAAMGRESMGRHILVSLPVGLGLGALLTLASTLVSFELLFRV